MVANCQFDVTKWRTLALSRYWYLALQSEAIFGDRIQTEFAKNDAPSFVYG